MEENVLISKTDSIDKDGGWFITHWTKTWDTRVRLDSISEQVAGAKEKRDLAEAEYQATLAKEALVKSKV